MHVSFIFFEKKFNFCANNPIYHCNITKPLPRLWPKPFFIGKTSPQCSATYYELLLFDCWQTYV